MMIMLVCTLYLVALIQFVFRFQKPILIIELDALRYYTRKN